MNRAGLVAAECGHNEVVGGVTGYLADCEGPAHPVALRCPGNALLTYRCQPTKGPSKDMHHASVLCGHVLERSADDRIVEPVAIEITCRDRKAEPVPCLR